MFIENLRSEHNLNEGSKRSAGLSRVSLKARAQPGVVVAFAAASAFVRVEVGSSRLLNRRDTVGMRLCVVSVSLDEHGFNPHLPGGASSSARVGVNLEKVLLSLNRGSREGDRQG